MTRSTTRTIPSAARPCRVVVGVGHARCGRVYPGSPQATARPVGASRQSHPYVLPKMSQEKPNHFGDEGGSAVTDSETAAALAADGHARVRGCPASAPTAERANGARTRVGPVPIIVLERSMNHRGRPAGQSLAARRQRFPTAAGRAVQALGAALLLLVVALAAVAPVAAQGAAPRSNQTADAAPPPPARRPAAPRPVTIQVPAIGVDAPIEVLTTVNNQMQDPTGPVAVAWYNDSARPGMAGNSVFAGHLDMAGVGPAVFARLKELDRGDLIVVTNAKGAVFRYRVVGARAFKATSDRWDVLTGPTDAETLTLITCAGPWDESTATYLNRLVVRAVRVKR